MFGLHPTIRFERLHRRADHLNGAGDDLANRLAPQNFYAGAAENASGGTSFDVLTGFFVTVLYIESF